MLALEVTLLVLSLLGLASTSTPLKPNIVLIVLDDLGWSDVGYQNITTMKTPNIDRLATEGVILDNYYVQPICSPTRSALLTGRYPIHTGMQASVIRPTEPYGLPLRFKLLPQELKEAGYSTHIIGKWHLGFHKLEYTPTYRGFDTFYGIYLGAVDHWTYERQGVPDLHDQTTPVTSTRNQYLTNLFTERAKQVIEAQDPSEPMFLYLPFLNVHAPIQAPARFTDMHKSIADPKRRVYAGMVSAVDEAIGNVTAALREKGIWNNTLVIFTTDNGGLPLKSGYNWPLRGFKTTLWEGGVRGVGFVHGEMIQAKGRRCRELLHVTDWYPTILSLAGIDATKEDSPPDGKNVWDTISTGVPSPREEILLNIDPPDEQPKGVKHFSILPPGEGVALRSGHMKLLLDVLDFPSLKPPELGGPNLSGRNSTNTTFQFKRIKLALYNITADPEEKHDLSNKYPEVVARLRKRVEYYKKGTVPSVKKGPDPMAFATAKKNGYWGPWISSNQSNSQSVNCFVLVLSVFLVLVSHFDNKQVQ